MQTFRINVPEDTLIDLRSRLKQTRWPCEVKGQGWLQGTDLTFLQRLCTYWAESFDWRSAEARLNELPQFRTIVSGTGLYVIHARSERKNAVPLLLCNGWPSSVFEYVDVIPRLTAAGFDVIAPAMPGYGFSDKPEAPGMNGTRIASLYATLMHNLGYNRFIAHGSDLGSHIVDMMRRNHPERLLGIHMSNVRSDYPRPDDASPEEQAFLEQAQRWMFEEGAYAMIQRTRPQSLAYGLNDSPAGLAGWIIEKFQAWSDGDIEQVYGLDAICANLTLYWITETACSSVRLYSEVARDHEMQTSPERGNVPAGVIMFPADNLPAPRVWGERWLNIIHWTEAPHGGHFAAWEAPDIFVNDICEFARKVLPARE